jgi:hypothetical protein
LSNTRITRQQPEESGDFPPDKWICFSIVEGNHCEVVRKLGELVLSEHCRIIPTPDWIKDSEFESKPTASLMEELVSSDFVLAYDYEAKALGDPIEVDGTTMSIQDLIADRLLLFNLAAWVVGPLELYSKGFFHFMVKDDYRVWRRFGGDVRLRILEQDNHVECDQEHISLLTTLWGQLISIRRNTAVWVAVWMMHKALYERFWFVRVLLIWVALEALFGPQERQQLTHQLCERIALFLKGSTDEGAELFSKLKKSYGIRSKVVHGGSLGGNDLKEGLRNLGFIEEIVRSSLVKILSAPENIECFSTRNRDKFLQGLVFGNG